MTNKNSWKNKFKLPKTRGKSWQAKFFQGKGGGPSGRAILLPLFGIYLTTTKPTAGLIIFCFGCLVCYWAYVKEWD